MGYIEDNAGVITASKLKAFLKCPETYIKKYELLEIPEKETSSLTLGTQIDEYVSYGEEWFFDNYVFEEKLLKKQLKERLFYKKIGFDDSMTVSELKELYYGNKIKIAPAVSEKIKNIISEIKRQPFFHIDGDYEVQYELSAEYKGLKLKGTLDRIDTTNGIIRDTKTCRDSRYHKAIKDYGYLFSMSFYDLLYELKTGEKAKSVILDFITTTGEPRYIPIEIPREVLEEKRAEVVYALNKYLECKKTGEFPSCTQQEQKDNMFPSYLRCEYPSFCSGCTPEQAIIFQEFL